LRLGDGYVPVNAKCHTGKKRGGEEKVEKNAILTLPEWRNCGEINGRLDVFRGVGGFGSHFPGIVRMATARY
jgi:hypothetical protein